MDEGLAKIRHERSKKDFPGLSLKEGDGVLFNSGAGTKLYDGNEVYRLLHVRDVLGKFFYNETEAKPMIITVIQEV